MYLARPPFHTTRRQSETKFISIKTLAFPGSPLTQQDDTVAAPANPVAAASGPTPTPPPLAPPAPAPGAGDADSDPVADGYDLWLGAAPSSQAPGPPVPVIDLISESDFSEDM